MKKISLGFLVVFAGMIFAGCSLFIEPSTNADLSGLAVDSGTLTPVFSAAITDYTVSVSNAVASITVTVTIADEDATAAIDPAQPSALTVGDNTITITVTAQSGATRDYTVIVTRSADYVSANIGTLISVPGGTFQRDAGTGNTSTVLAFHMSENEITRAQFTAVTGLADPSDAGSSTGNSDPVQQVRWYHALVFCNRLSVLEGLTPVYTIGGSIDPAIWGTVPTSGDVVWNAATANRSANGYRLPTEMEWMWAAMGATSSYLKAFAGSTGSNVIGDYAWWGWTGGNAGTTTHPVGTKTANELGLHDMSGNVEEWCWDWYAVYPAGAQPDYTGAPTGTYRVARGGDFFNSASNAMVAYRNYHVPYFASAFCGFRVVRP